MADWSLWQGKPLSASEAVSRVFATPSVHGPVCQSFGYHSSQIFISNNQPARSKQPVEWTLTSTHWGILRGRHTKLEAKLHTWALHGQTEIPTLAIGCWKQWEDHRDSLWEEELQSSRTIIKQELTGSLRLSWTCDFGDSGQIDGSREDNNSAQKWLVGLGSKSQLQRLLSNSIAFVFLRVGTCVPVVSELFQKALHGATCGGVAVMRLGLMSESSQEDDNAEVKDKDTDGSLSSKGLRLLSGACCLPHPEKDTGGEDAYFICPDKQVVGVADGVGGWADMGVDAGEYARELMNQSLIAARQEPRGFIDPARVLERAHAKTTCPGSSTACILALSDFGLQAANLGDSGFVVVRNSRKIFKSSPQQHKFNMPFQLESGGGDPPSAAEVFTVEVAVGDVIVAGTDGLFDNLYDSELTSIVVHAIRSGLSPDITAHKIASLARLRAQDCNRQTPFSTAAQDAGFVFYGGKMDDITVVVSYITNSKVTAE